MPLSSIITTVVFTGISVILSYFVAKKKNRKPILWMVMAILFSWISLAILLFLKKKKEEVNKEESSSITWRRTSSEGEETEGASI